MSEFDDTAETVREIAKRDREIETLRARVEELEEASNFDHEEYKRLRDDMKEQLYAAQHYAQQLRDGYEAQIKGLLDPIVRAKMLEPSPPIFINNDTALQAENARLREALEYCACDHLHPAMQAKHLVAQAALAGEKQMTPTPHLRFVMRQETFEIIHDGYTSIGKVEQVKVLQQWWDATNTGSQIPDHGEWRDVPTEEENK